MNTPSPVINHLKDLGIQPGSSLFYNAAFDLLYAHETDPALTGTEKGTVTSSGAVSVDTGRFTGRSPKDKYIVKEPSSKNHVWWAEDGSDNQPMSPETWSHLKQLAATQLNNKKLYIIDGFCGANPETRLSIRLITEVAWIAHFFKNMFIRPTDSELKAFKPDWTILNASKTTCQNPQQLGLRSEVFVAFHIQERMTVIGGTWYGGEIKKGIFSIMNYFLPLKGIGAFHCSCNMGQANDTALFFGLSGTGKTTLSTDPKRRLIGDDEHGWDHDGVFNFEGGCYAKVIDLSQEREPDIYRAIKRDALLENVVVNPDGNIDFSSAAKTENTRVSYPIYHIDNIVTPISKGPHPKKIIFLTCDAYGVLPPVVKLSTEQAMYQYLTGYTAKVAGTELGIKEPSATFSSCFGQPFLLLHPTKYAEILGQKMAEHNSAAYLVNTGWCGGKYGVGKRISLKNTRALIDAILDGTVDQTETEIMPLFNFAIPKAVPNVDSHILNPRNAWTDKTEYDATAKLLAEQFIKNFKKYTGTPLGKSLENAGPKL